MKTSQPSFSGGELDPGLHGRTDVARYLTSLATCRNAVVKPSGGAFKRPGRHYRGEVKTSSLNARLLPFIYSTETRYLIEAGHLYFRFHYLDANNQLFRLESPPGTPIEVATPYTTADLENIRFTQSADVMYLVCRGYQQRELRRLTPTSFELRLHENRNGPFRPINTNDGVRAAVSAAVGNVTVTCSDPIFTAGHVGALFYVEEPELRDITPWEPASKNVGVGELRRSDGKVYRCTAVHAGGTYHVSGGVRPVHESGRAWDGSGDVRSDGVNDYAVGVEWEFVHPGFGVVKLSAFNNANSMDGLVMTRIPDSCVGAVAALHTWTASGDGSAKTFPIAGNTSASVYDYTVQIDGAGVQP